MEQVKLDRSLICAAIGSYHYKLEQEINFWHAVSLEGDNGRDEMIKARETENAIRLELYKLNEMLKELQAGGSCLADYNFFAEKRERF